MRYYIQLMRPKQWVKNFFVFSALIFSNKFTNAQDIIIVSLVFLSFCFISSSVYIMNDIIDVEKDRLHPKKKNRPIAANRVSKNGGRMLMIAMIIISIILAYSINLYVIGIVVVYFINNIAYSFKIKSIVLMDILSIAFGFLLRVISGGVCIGVSLSPWILLCTLFISLFLGVEKRKDEIKRLSKEAINHRPILEEYSIDFINQLSNIIASCTIVFYALYTFFAQQNSYLLFTNIFVIYGLFRYKYLVEIKNSGGSPTDTVLTDKYIIVTVLLWGMTYVLVFTLFK